MNSTMKHRLAAVALAGFGLSLAGVAALSPAIAQPDETTRPTVDIKIRVTPLRHTSVGEFSMATRGMFKDPFSTVSYDERTNSVIVMGTPEIIESVNDLIQLLDVQVDESEADERIEVFSLKHVAANGPLVVTLSEVLRVRERGANPLRLSIDLSTNQLIARGTSRTLAQLKSLLTELDKPAASEREVPDINVRLIWLTTSATRKVPADMKDVTDALADMGITGLSMAAQTIIRTTNYGEFGTEFTTGGDEPWFVRFAGTAETSDAENWMLEVSLNGRRARSDGPGIPGSVEFETRLSTQAGHFVVLGVSPIGDTDSVFVLQVIDAD